MVNTTVNTTLWECGICKNIYTNQKSAERCESQGKHLDFLPKGTVFFDPSFEWYARNPRNAYVIIRQPFTLTRRDHHVVYLVDAIYENPFSDLTRRGEEKPLSFYMNNTLLGFDGKNLCYPHGNNNNLKQGYELDKSTFWSKFNLRMLSQEEIETKTSTIGVLEQSLKEINSLESPETLIIPSLLSGLVLVQHGDYMIVGAPIFDKFE